MTTVNKDYGVSAIRNTLSNCRKKVYVGLEQVSDTEIYKQIEALAETGLEYTQTYLPQLQARFSPETLTEITHKLLFDYRKRYVFHVILIGEISLTGMFHMHGVIKAPPKMINSLKRRLPRELGRAELKMIHNTQTWTKYCFKDEYTGEYKNTDEIDYIHIDSPIAVTKYLSGA